MIRRSPLFSFATLLCLIALYLQFSWRLQPSDITLPGRALLAFSCQQLDCELPRRGEGQWQLSELRIEPHAEYYNILDVHATLTSTAPKAGPPPALGLSFTDLSAQIIAARRFPAPTAHAQQDSIDLHWEVVNPGQNAQGHQLELLIKY